MLMAEFKTAMITDAGKKLLADTLAGKARMKFYCIGIGDGSYNGTEDLSAMTKLKSQKQKVFLSSVSKESNNCVKIKALISNESLTEGYYMTEMGLYAMDETVSGYNPVLYSVAVAKKADYFPEYNGKVPVTILQEYYASVSDTENVNIYINDDTYTLLEDFEEFKNFVNNTVYTEAKDKDGGNADTVDGYHALDLRNYNNLINKPASLPANGGNADTVDGYHASEFSKYREFNSLDELAETQYEGLFYIGGSDGITGISLKSGRDIDIQPDKSVVLEIYTRIYNDKEGKTYAATDVYSTEYDFWTRKGLKTFSFDGHSHSVNDIENFPVSLPASGGNADTVGGKHASDFAETNHTHEKSDIMDFPASLPANGGNADTVDGYHASDLLNYNNLTNSPDFNTSTNKTTFDIPQQGLYQVKCADNSSPNGKNGIWSLLVIGDGTGGYMNTGNNYITQLAFYGEGVTYTRDCNMTNNEDDDTIYDWGEWRKINDGGNANTISGKGINAIQTRDSGYCFYNQNKDWNDLTDTGYYGLMHSTSTALHNPVNGKFFYPMVFKYANDSITQIAVPHLAGHDDGGGMVYIRSKNSSYNGWSEWRKVGRTLEQIVKTSSIDLNSLHGETALYNIQGNFTNGPDGIGSWGSLLSLYGIGSEKTIQVYFPDTGSDMYIRRGTKEGANWNEWTGIGDGVRKYKKTFTASAGNWYRIIKGTFDYCGGVFTLTGGLANARSATVFSASHCFNYVASADKEADNKLVRLSHSVFYGFISKIRMVYSDNGDVFIDFYVGKGTGAAELNVIFNGMGWKVLDSVETVNSDSGVGYKEITL